MQHEELEKIILDWAAVFMRLSMHDFTRYTRRSGLSLAQMNVLMHLYYKGSSEVMDFSDALQLSPAGASQLVDRMAQQGLVVRLEGQQDRRVRMVYLTDLGRSVVEESIAARGVWLESLMVSLTEAEKQSVAEALRVLTEKATQLER